jgi:hypothetical protein
MPLHFKKYFVFSPSKHNNMFTVYYEVLHVSALTRPRHVALLNTQ